MSLEQRAKEGLGKVEDKAKHAIEKAKDVVGQK